MMRITDPPSPETAREYARLVIDAIIAYNTTEDRQKMWIDGYTLIEGKGLDAIESWMTLERTYRWSDYINFYREMEWALDERWEIETAGTGWPRPVAVIRIRGDIERFATDLPTNLLRWHTEADWQSSMDTYGYAGVRWGKDKIADAVAEVEALQPGWKLIPYPGSTLYADGQKWVGGYAVLCSPTVQTAAALECIKIAQRIGTPYVYIEGKGHDSELVDGIKRQFRHRRPGISYWLAPGLPCPGEPGSYTANWIEALGIITTSQVRIDGELHLMTAITGDTWPGVFPDDQYGPVPGQYDDVPESTRERLYRAGAPAQEYLPVPTLSEKP
jgi:hypothetical protein